MSAEAPAGARAAADSREQQAAPSVLQRLSPGRRAWLRWWIIGTVVSVGSLVAAFYSLDIGGILRGVAEADAALFAASVAASLVSLVFRTFRWRALFGDTPAPPTFRLFSVLFAGQPLSATFPAGVAEVSKTLLLGRYGSRPLILTTIALEKAIDAAMLLIFFVALLVSGASLAWFERTSLVLGLVLVTLVVLAAVVASRLARADQDALERIGTLPVLRRLGLAKRLPMVVAGLGVLSRPQRMMAVITWSLLMWASWWAATYAALASVGLNMALGVPILVLVIQYLGSPIPSPGRVGTHQALSMIALGVVGVSAARAAPFSIVYYLSVVVAPVLVGTVFLWYEIASAGADRRRAREAG